MINLPSPKGKTEVVRVREETSEKAKNLAKFWNTTLIEVYRYAVDRLFLEVFSQETEG